MSSPSRPLLFGLGFVAVFVVINVGQSLYFSNTSMGASENVCQQQ